MSSAIYRKKPIEVEVSLPWDGTASRAAELVQFTYEEGKVPRFRRHIDGDPDLGQVWDQLHTTWITVYSGQRIVRGVLGEFYPIDPGALADTYDLVQEVTTV